MKCEPRPSAPDAVWSAFSRLHGTKGLPASTTLGKLRTPSNSRTRSSAFWPTTGLPLTHWCNIWTTRSPGGSTASSTTSKATFPTPGTGTTGQVHSSTQRVAAGVRVTGIGCFFDDPVHEVMGFRDASFQSLYHFTTGGPVEDPRLTTLPPYDLDH